MSYVIPVKISAWQQIKDFYKSRTISQRLEPYNGLSELSSLLNDDILTIAKNKDRYYEIVAGTLSYYKSNHSGHILIAAFPPDWKGYPTWGLSIPILNYENTEISFYEGNYTKNRIHDDLGYYDAPIWEDTPTLVESVIINTPMLVNMDVPFSLKNQSDSPSIVLNLRFNPSLLKD
jgi:hypothetical protein